MQFSNFTQNTVSLFINNFDNCLLEQSSEEISLQKKYLTLIYNNIVLSEKQISSLNKKQKCLTPYSIPTPCPTEINNIHNLKLPSAYNTRFFSEIIRNQIIERTEHKVTYSCVLGHRTIKIDFFFMRDDPEYEKYNMFANMVFVAINMLTKYASNNCSKELHILVYLTDIKKLLPDNTYTILEPLHVNGGFTTTCEKVSEIVIFRKEEWFKVLLHECFHNLGLDFSLMNISELKKTMKKQFPIDCKFDLFETYCEVWARILNACISSYFTMEDKSLEKFYLYSDLLLQTERLFSLYQCNKILNFMGLTLDGLCKTYLDGSSSNTKATNLLYKEKTNVFAYYIMGSLMMNNYVRFMHWCDVNNTKFLKFTETQDNLDEFCRYIITEVEHDYEKEQEQSSFRMSLQRLNATTKKNYKYIKKHNNELINSSRMSLFEFVP